MNRTQGEVGPIPRDQWDSAGNWLWITAGRAGQARLDAPCLPEETVDTVGGEAFAFLFDPTVVKRMR